MNQSSVCGLVDLLPTSDALSADRPQDESMVQTPWPPLNRWHGLRQANIMITPNFEEDGNYAMFRNRDLVSV
ncbi:hypothetical protein NHH03_00225 [Stieleria sp. TO1_6]|uniref:hypothetical protein n=1 Tax=Stieleria tagensis TaxID=2956795 RepID=UPI00209B7A32|nr:hypothetical protein [Stieleria tagensis]MCO8120145.1 hypothetical protein [Stieleria tagensis]